MNICKAPDELTLLSASLSGFVRLNTVAPLIEPPHEQRFVLAIDPASPPAGLEGAVVAIGNFDGVHRGHAAVVERASALARKLGKPCAVLTFEPHPTDFFRGPQTIFRLTPLAAKARALERLKVDGVIVVPFDAALATLGAETFVSEILVRRLGVAAVVAGYDFHFGAHRAGTPDLLKEIGERQGFAVDIVPPILADGDRLAAASSTATRAALEAGDVVGAARLLGRPYSILGEVIHGQKLGRTLGFPTANLTPDPSCRLRHGVYAVRVETEGRLYDGAASFGRRPTFDDGPALLEAYLFDFSGDLYGETIEVFFVGWIRPELKFGSAAALVAQMNEDVIEAKEILGAISPV
jgi:riboflavin kinase/FMN adenylyltransferase